MSVPVQVFGRLPPVRVDGLVFAGVRKPAQEQTSCVLIQLPRRRARSGCRLLLDRRAFNDR